MSNCAHCSAADATKICSRCVTARYCSSECQRAHWNRHKPDCKKKSPCPLCNRDWAACECEDKPICWICLDSDGELLRGCACRGSAGCAENVDQSVFVYSMTATGSCTRHAWSKPTSIEKRSMTRAQRVSRSSPGDCKWLSPGAE